VHTPAGAHVQFAVTLVNTGTVRASAPALSVPDIVAAGLACSLADGSAVTLGSPATELEPGASIRCTSSHTVTLEDVEGAAQHLEVSASAGSVLGPAACAPRQLSLVPTPAPRLGVSLVGECERPERAGEVVFSGRRRGSAAGVERCAQSHPASAHLPPPPPLLLLLLMLPWRPSPHTPSPISPRPAGSDVQCAVQIHNAGNVRVADVHVFNHACQLGLMAPSAIRNCTHTHPASQEDFEAGWVRVLGSAAGVAQGQLVLGPPMVSEDWNVTLPLQQTGTVQVAGTVWPPVLGRPGPVNVTYVVANTGNLRQHVSLWADRVQWLACAGSGGSSNAALEPGASVACRCGARARPAALLLRAQRLRRPGRTRGALCPDAHAALAVAHLHARAACLQWRADGGPVAV
jgi:hypothetical protein